MWTGKIYGCLKICLKVSLRKTQLTACAFLLIVAVKSMRRSSHVKDMNLISEEIIGVQGRAPRNQEMSRDESMISSKKRADESEYCISCDVSLNSDENESRFSSGKQSTSTSRGMTPMLCFCCRKTAAEYATDIELRHQPRASTSERKDVEFSSSHAANMETRGVNETEFIPQAMSHDLTVSQYVWYVATKICDVDFPWSSASLLARVPFDLMRAKRRKVEGEDADSEVPKGSFTTTVHAVDEAKDEDDDGPCVGNDIAVMNDRRVPGNRSAVVTGTDGPDVRDETTVASDREDSDTRTGDGMFDRGQRRVIGISNLGNTCYFNSVLQCLGALEPMREHYLSTTVARKERPLVSALHDFYIATSDTPNRQSEAKRDRGYVRERSMNVFRTYNPTPFLKAVRDKYPQFKGGKQEDSLDLLKCILDGLHVEETTVGNPEQGDAGVDQIFGFLEANSSECQVCFHKTTSIQRSRSISLPVWMLSFRQGGSSEENVEQGRLRGGGGGELIDIDNESFSRCLADLASQFPREETEQKGDTPGVADPIQSLHKIGEGERRHNTAESVEKKESGVSEIGRRKDISISVGSEVASQRNHRHETKSLDEEALEVWKEVGARLEEMGSDMNVSLAELEVGGLDYILWTPTGGHVAKCQTDLKLTGPEDDLVAITGQLGDVAPGFGLMSEVKRQEEEGRLPGNDMWEEGERKRGWEVPLNGVRVVKDYIAEQKLAPQVTGEEEGGQPIAPSSSPIDSIAFADRAQFDGAFGHIPNSNVAEPEVDGTSALPPTMRVDCATSGAIAGKKLTACGTTKKSISICAPMPISVRVTLHDCLVEYTKNEEFGGENGWYCTGCTDLEKKSAKETLRAKILGSEIQTDSNDIDVDVDDWWPPVRSDMTIKQTLLSTLPQVLVFHLNRFENDGFRPGYFKKTSGHVAFEEILNMQPYMDKMVVDGSYRLTGIVSHFGTIGSGHYVAYVRGARMSIENTQSFPDVDPPATPWFCCSDTCIKETRLVEVLHCEAYLLFYQKI